MKRWRPDGLLAGLVVLFALAALHDRPLISDENHHARQALAFAAGDWTVLPSLTVLPIWHALVGTVAGLFEQPGLLHLRSQQAVAAIGAVLALGWMGRGLEAASLVDGSPAPPPGGGGRLLQTALFPLVFPFAALVYTDLPALIPAALCLGSALRGRHGLALGFGLLAVLLRQTNIFVLLAASLVALGLFWEERREEEPSFSDVPRAELRTALARFLLLYVLPLALLGSTMLGLGAAIGEQDVHHISGLHTGNLLFGLASIPLLFWPVLTPGRASLVSARIEQALEGATRRPSVRRAAAAGLVLGLLLVALLWTNSHPYNQGRYDFFLHNRALSFFDSSFAARLVLGLLAGLGAVMVVQLVRRRLVVGLALLGASQGLLLAEMVEPRYWLVPLLIVQLARRRSSGRNEVVLSAWWALLSLGLLRGFRDASFFL